MNQIISNGPPVAKAGADQTIALTTLEVVLDGSSSTDPDENIRSHTWKNISGPSSVTIADTAGAVTKATGLVKGAYLFELTVTDTEGLFSKDTVMVTVSEIAFTYRWTKWKALPEKEFVLGRNHINFLLGIGNKMFAIGKDASFWLYDPQENEWDEAGELPSSMASSNFSVVFSIGDKGYLIGNGTSRQYNAVTGKWVTKNNAPVGADHVDYSIPLVIGDKAYLVGSTNNKVTLYDPVTDTYTLKNDFPDVSAATGFVINGAGFCVQQDGRCWKYDAVSDTWQQQAGLPPSIYNMSAFTLNGYGYVMGDPNRDAYNGTGTIKLWRYDPSANTWTGIDEDYPGDGVYAIKTASLNNIVYVGLGYNDGDFDANDFWSFE